jgi:hypothetical protein
MEGLFVPMSFVIILPIKHVVMLLVASIAADVHAEAVADILILPQAAGSDAWACV